MKLYYRLSFGLSVATFIGFTAMFGWLFYKDMMLERLPSDLSILLYWLWPCLSLCSCIIEYFNIGKNYIELNEQGLLRLHKGKASYYDWQDIQVVFIQRKYFGIPSKGLFCIYKDVSGKSEKLYLGASKKLIQFVGKYTNIISINTLQKNSAASNE